MRTPPSIQLTLRNKVFGSLAAGLITIAMFLAIPLTQIASEYVQNTRVNNDSRMRLAPPPPLVEETPIIEEKEIEKDEEAIELEKTFEPINLALLDLALNAGQGNSANANSIYVGSFEVNDNELDLNTLIFEINQLDKPPLAIQQVAPFYPSLLKRQRIEGSVIAECVVTDSGKVTRIRITKSSHLEFKQPVVNALKQWRFHPGIKNDEEVNTRVRIPFYFNLKTG